MVIVMKKKFIILGIVFIIILALVINYGVNKKYENDLKKIQESKVTFLDNYNRNKALAESYLDVYQIVDEGSYQRVKNYMYNSFSSEMRQELFPSVNYTGLDLHSMSTTEIRCIGTNNQTGENTFLLEYNLKGVNYDQDITNLITIENGQIQKVIRIR